MEAWADFLPKVYAVPELTGVHGVRVLYRLTWYTGTSNSISGRANHYAYWHKETYEGTNIESWHEDYCVYETGA